MTKKKTVQIPLKCTNCGAETAKPLTRIGTKTRCRSCGAAIVLDDEAKRLAAKELDRSIRELMSINPPLSPEEHERALERARKFEELLRAAFAKKKPRSE